MNFAKKMFVVYLIIFLISLKILHKIFYGNRDRLLSKFPTPKSYPLIHNTLEFHDKSVVDIFPWIEEKTRELGSIWYMTMHPFDSSDFIVTDPVVAEKLLSSQKLLEKGADYKLLVDWLGTGLLISSGTKWHQRRKIITPAFHFSILERFVDIMDEQGKTFVEKLKSHESKVVDIFPLAGLYALDVICGELIIVSYDKDNRHRKLKIIIHASHRIQSRPWEAKLMHKMGSQIISDQSNSNF